MTMNEEKLAPEPKKIATHAAMFRIRLGEEKEETYFIMMGGGDDGNSVRGFENMRKGLDHFEDAYQRAFERGYGWTAGAIMNAIQLSPRIFHFGTVENLKAMFGLPDVIHPEKLWGTGVHEYAVRCPDQERAKTIYDAATEPRPR
jgi:hypothetical protein